MKWEAWRTKSCAITWYHQLSLQLAVGFIILNSKHIWESYLPWGRNRLRLVAENAASQLHSPERRREKLLSFTLPPENDLSFWAGHSTCLRTLLHTHRAAMRSHWWLQRDRRVHSYMYFLKTLLSHHFPHGGTATSLYLGIPCKSLLWRSEV